MNKEDRLKQFLEDRNKVAISGKYEDYDTFKAYKKALKEKCDAIDKAIEYIHNHQLVFELSNKEQIQKWFDEFYTELLNILRGEE